MYNRNYQPLGQFSNQNNFTNRYPSDERLIGGGFLGPFILGGITGGVVAPYFWNRPNYQPYPYPPNYYYYGGYYR